MPETDWERIGNMSVEEVCQNALDDLDNPLLTDDEMANLVRARNIQGKTVA